MMNVDDLVEVAAGVTKRLGDCTADDLEAAARLKRAEAERHEQAANALLQGSAPSAIRERRMDATADVQPSGGPR